jgi:serine/threonine protein kinase
MRERASEVMNGFPQPHKAAGSDEAPAGDERTLVADVEAFFASNTANIAPGSMLAPGTRIHHYEFIRLLGSGGMGTVFLARDTRLGRRVAIKFLHSTHPEITRRFILEARATARCSHENIVIIYEVGEFRGNPFMVLEYLQGQVLSKLFADQRLPPARAVELIVPVVRALVCAHAQGIAHRDLKPDNIIVTESGTIKVLDFGIAKILQAPQQTAEHESEGCTLAHPLSQAASVAIQEDGVEQTRRGTIMGTLAYMSPEQWRGGQHVDHQTDIWAVGIMLFRMIAGRHPLDPLRGSQLVVTAHLDDPMPRLKDVVPDVAPALADVVDRCLIKRKEERMQDAHSLLRLLEPFLPGSHVQDLRSDESPYTGLSPFQESDSSRFFGRSREVASLLHRIHGQPLIAVVGPSGAGKSSFVRAGLVPALKHSGEAWEVLVIRPGRHPLAALASIIAPLVTSSTTVEEDVQAQQQLVTRLHTEPGYVGSVLRSHAHLQRRKILLFIDQFEELYTQVADTRERLAFTACLADIGDDATSPLRGILSIRSDFLDRVSEDEHFMAALNQGLFFLSALNREALRDALVRPAEMVGYRFETPAMIENMLQDLEATQGALPLLQFAATQLWEERDPARKVLSEERYRAMGGIAGALACHADSVLAELSFQARGLAREAFLRLVTPERTRAIVSLEELQPLSKDGSELQLLIDRLVQARLLVVQTGGDASSATIEIVHESLIHSWPTLHRWLDEGQDDVAFLEQLRNSARQWQNKGHDEDLLWRGEMVEEARRFHRRYRGELPQLQRDFLGAVFAQDEKNLRRKRALVIGSTVFLSLLVVAAVIALVVIRHAQQESERQAIVAQRAEVEARQRLAEVQAKELERQQAQQKVEVATAQVVLTTEELQRKNEELSNALKVAGIARKTAELNELAARRAQQEAIRAAQQLEILLQRERERKQRLETKIEGKPGKKLE